MLPEDSGCRLALELTRQWDTIEFRYATLAAMLLVSSTPIINNPYPDQNSPSVQVNHDINGPLNPPHDALMTRLAVGLHQVHIPHVRQWRVLSVFHVEERMSIADKDVPIHGTSPLDSLTALECLSKDSAIDSACSGVNPIQVTCVPKSIATLPYL